MTSGDVDPRTAIDEPGPAVTALFGDRLALAQRYVDLLAGDGVEHGLLGPREVPRLWDRHVANSALLAGLLPDGARVVDVGSGAGLPGLALAIRRPDLQVDLVEPMLRRTAFLQHAVDVLDLSRSVRVVRGRADDAPVIAAAGGSEWVVARAVGPLDRLARWCHPLLRPSGTMLAMKGRSAGDEVSAHRPSLLRLGFAAIEVLQLDVPGFTPTWVVSAVRSAGASTRSRKGLR